MVTGDGAYIKKLNRSILIKEIVKHEKISRADLSKITGLNKATVTVQVADLLNECLIVETQQEHHGVGRKPIMLSLNPKVGYVVGIDLDYEQIQFRITDLLGHSILEEKDVLQTNYYEEILQYLIKKLEVFQTNFSDNLHGIVGVVIGIHGTVNNDEVINFVPKFHWRNKDLKSDLQKQVSLPIYIENNANLSSFAEKVYQHQESKILLTLLLTSGIGTGIMIDGKIYKGFHGYAGEMGHMILYPNGEPCKCGNHGCWERYASQPALLRHLSHMLEKPDLTLEDVRILLNEEDPIVMKNINKFLLDLSIGLNNVINLYNPEIVVLNSELLKFIPNAIEKIKSNLHSNISQYREIALSDLGDSAGIMGACALGITRFLEIEGLHLTLNSDIFTS